MNKARETADFYSAHVEGFKDYDCSYDIIEEKVIGELSGDCVYVVSGWNVNENLDEVEIIEIECFSHEAAATQYMIQLQRMQKRTNWCIGKYSMNESLWKEGFTRYQY